MMVCELALLLPREKSLPLLPLVKEEPEDMPREEPADAGNAQSERISSTQRAKKRRRLQRCSLCVVGGIPWIDDGDGAPGV